MELRGLSLNYIILSIIAALLIGFFVLLLTQNKNQDILIEINDAIANSVASNETVRKNMPISDQLGLDNKRIGNYVVTLGENVGLSSNSSASNSIVDGNLLDWQGNPASAEEIEKIENFANELDEGEVGVILLGD